MAKGKKYAGRQKGTPNKSNQTVMDKAKELGVDPFEILLRFAADDWEGLGYAARSTISYTGAGIEFEELVIKPDMRIKASAEACKYLYAQRRSVETTIDPALVEKVDAWKKLPREELLAIRQKITDSIAIKIEKE